MTKLPEHSPKPDLWSKIQQRKNFDSQVNAHAANLPVQMPKADLWSDIESKLDQKAPVIPFWKYAMAAASIMLILALSGIAYLQFGEKEVDTSLITEVITQAPALNTIGEDQAIKTEPAFVEPEQIALETAEPKMTQKQTINRETSAPIEFPKLTLAELSVENTLISKLNIPPAPEKEVAKTLHQVSISWSKIKPRIQVKTQFGQQELELGQTSQASVDHIGQVTIEINN
ncbi:hypothetical protein [Algoriphagus antarcticus]|uniref:Uncharacterized protein n=1 Tax=Algoriphagus antarcticus TaxID=238540 RepID=A0A3E0DWR2_9BACT|nr:hypothetical protein [Algoriphagus antarcticus]REG90537.1 hypothetical protein C8N25_10635 [Algoriphagus antarcticus]